MDDKVLRLLLETPLCEDANGFYETLIYNEQLSPCEANRVFALAFVCFREAVWHPTDIAIRNFLRSRWGSHFANAIACYDGTFEARICRVLKEDWVVWVFEYMERGGGLALK